MNEKKVVIIGGGFAGSVLAKKLERDFKTTLIDKKDYFEFTPGILKSIVKPKHLKSLHVKHKKYLKNTTFKKGNVTKISREKVFLGRKAVPYDYLVIASGSSYHTPIKFHRLVNSSNSKVLEENYHNLCKAKDVLIVGGGIVGVELAAEIALKYKDEIKGEKKKVTIIQSGSHLMPRENKKAKYYAEFFLKEKGIKLIFNQRCTKKDMETYDFVLFATGITPNSKYLPKTILNERKFVKVKPTLEVSGYDNVFAAGDITNIKEEKLAQTAEVHAKLISENIKAKENEEPLEVYHPKSRLKLISLGPYNGILSYKTHTLTGFIPGIFKTLFEKFHMFHIRWM